MSGPLLIGIAAVGVGWMWIHRSPGPAATSSRNTAAQDADAATVDDAAHAGMPAVIAAVDGESPATSIGDPVTGVEGGQILPIDQHDGGAGQQILAIDPTKSTGGADPSTQPTSLHDGKPEDSPPAIVQGDTEDTIIASKYGICGADGLTRSQVSNAYRDSAVWSGEVF